MPREEQQGLSSDAGGVPIPDAVKRRVEAQIRAVAEDAFAERYTKLDIRFREQFCYVDAYRDPEDTGPGWPPPDWHETREERLERLRNTPIHLCRLRYFGEDNRWGFAFYNTNTDKYEPATFPDGESVGTPEEAFRVSAAVYLTGEA